MRVPDIFLDCVCFVCFQNEHGMAFAGTAFFLASDKAKPSTRMGYTVTAWHVIQSIREKSKDGKTYLRLNSIDGKFGYEQFDTENWVRHPSDTSVDVAVLRWIPPPSYFYNPFDTNLLLTPELAILEDIGIGDDVFLAGLFRQNIYHNNMPILRQGSIARMPIENIPTTLFGSIEAFLVEVRSLGGLSGSPVFVFLSSLRRTRTEFRFQPIAYLIGLVHGHFETSIPQHDELEQDQQKQKEINAGIAVVVTANEILVVTPKSWTRNRLDLF